MSKTAYGRTFEAPRPGAWEIDSTHYPRPTTPFVREQYLPTFRDGFAEGAKHYGLLLSHMDYIDVHGFVYTMPRAVGAPETAKGPPPKPIFKLLTWLHPEVRRRIRRSREILEQRSWLADLKYWDDEVKPQAIAAHMALQRVDPRTLDTAALVDHLRAAGKNAADSCYRHGRFTITACLPVGDYLAHARDWTGLPVHTLLRPIKGYSEVSNGVAVTEIERLAALLRNDAAGRALLDKPAPEALQALRDAPDPIGGLARAWLDQVSYRIVTGYDVCDHYGLELPDTLVQALRIAIEGSANGTSGPALDAELAELRDRVPASERPKFDALLADARAVYRLREERDHYNDGWATGLMRRGYLEAGRRAAEAGKLAHPELIVDASLDEAIDIVRGQGPSSGELSKRAEWRKTTDSALVPQNLGFAPSGPPPADWLPPHAARLARGIEIFLFGLFQPSDRESTAHAVHGIPVSPGTYEGRARVVLGAEDFGQVQRGEVLVTRSTSPYFNVLLPLLGAIVTDRGGALSHAAIVAREYGIPGVVGTKTATSSIRTGQRIRVDGTLGEVKVLAT